MKKKIFSLILLLAVMIMPLSLVKATDGYFNSNENVNDSNTYSHSSFVAGGNVKTSGKVEGLAFVAGATVEANSNVEYGIMAGESVEVNSVVEKDLFLAGNNLKLTTNASVGRDAYIAGNKIDISANINGNAFIAGSLITLNNITINGDLNIASEQLDIQGNVTINGKLIINEDARINNSDKLKYTSKETYKASRFDFNFKSAVTEVVLSVLTLIFAAIILIVLFPKLLGKIDAELSAKDIGMKILKGFITLIVVPIVGLLSLAVMVGLTLSVIIFALYIIAITLSTIFASYVIGNWIYTKVFKQKENRVVSTSFMIIVIKLVEYIPYIGPLVSLAVFLYGLGIICQLFIDRNK